MVTYIIVVVVCVTFFFQAEDGIRDLVRSRGLGDVYKRQGATSASVAFTFSAAYGDPAAGDLTFEVIEGTDTSLSLIHI